MTVAPSKIDSSKLMNQFTNVDSPTRRTLTVKSSPPASPVPRRAVNV